MSEYGPAIFCARPDGAEISDEEQGELGTLVAVVVWIDAALFAALLGISLWRLKEPVPAEAQPTP